MRWEEEKNRDESFVYKNITYTRSLIPVQFHLISEKGKGKSRHLCQTTKSMKNKQNANHKTTKPL